MRILIVVCASQVLLELTARYYGAKIGVRNDLIVLLQSWCFFALNIVLLRCTFGSTQPRIQKYILFVYKRILNNTFSIKLQHTSLWSARNSSITLPPRNPIMTQVNTSSQQSRGQDLAYIGAWTEESKGNQQSSPPWLNEHSCRSASETCTFSAA